MRDRAGRWAVQARCICGDECRGRDAAARIFTVRVPIQGHVGGRPRGAKGVLIHGGSAELGAEADTLVPKEQVRDPNASIYASFGLISQRCAHEEARLCSVNRLRSIL